MSASPQLSARALRTATVNTLDRMVRRCAELQLSAPPEVLTSFAQAGRRHLRVLVVGAAKRGKTTFVNALIGADVLPHRRQRHHEPAVLRAPRRTEGYRLRFEDGSAPEIGADDLESYGSEIAGEEGRAPSRRIAPAVDRGRPPCALPSPTVGSSTCPALGRAIRGTRRDHAPLRSPGRRRDFRRSTPTSRSAARRAKLLESPSSRSRRGSSVSRPRSTSTAATRGSRRGSQRADPDGSGSASVSATARLAGVEHQPAGRGRERRRRGGLSQGQPLPRARRALREFLADVCAAPRAVAALILATPRTPRRLRQVLDDRLQSLTRSSEATPRPTANRSRQRRAEFRGRVGRSRLRARGAGAGDPAHRDISKKSCRESLQPTGRSRRAMERAHRRDQDDRRGEPTRRDAGRPTSSPPASTSGPGSASCEPPDYAELLEPLLVASENLMPEVDVAGSRSRTTRPAPPVRTITCTTACGRRFGYSMPMYTAAGLAISLVASPLVIAAAAGGVLGPSRAAGRSH